MSGNNDSEVHISNFRESNQEYIRKHSETMIPQMEEETQ